MSLNIITDRCTIQNDRGNVVIESNAGANGDFSSAFDELQSPDARKLAQTYASQLGVANARINGNVIGPYAVNVHGTPLDEVRGKNNEALPQTHPDMQPSRYRIDVPVCSPLR